MAVKTDRLRKLEAEHSDLTKWLNLGMVPKQDIEKHKLEIEELEARLKEEHDRIEQMRQSGQPEEFITPKRQSSKLVVNDGPSISDLEISDSEYEGNSVIEGESRDYDTQATEAETRDDTAYDDYDIDDPFHEKNRWRKREIVDPDADEW